MALFLLPLFGLDISFPGDLGPSFSRIIWIVFKFQNRFSGWAVGFILCVVVVVVIVVVVVVVTIVCWIFMLFMFAGPPERPPALHDHHHLVILVN